MKRFSAVLFTLAALALTAGCHAQLPVTSSYNVNYSATFPTAPACSATPPALPCQLAFSWAAQTAGVCPSAAAVPSPYALACTSASQVTSCTQAAAPTGTTICAIAQTVQGGANSPPTVPITVAIPSIPAVPTAPAAAPAAVTTAQLSKPAIAPAPMPAVTAKDTAAPTGLVAVVERVR